MGCSLLYFITRCGYRWIIRLGKSACPGNCIVLYYHGISSRYRHRFAHQMAIVKKWSIPIPADYNLPLQKEHRYTVITFDDGFTSVLQNALPELMKRSIPATIFVPTGYIGKPSSWLKTADERYRCDTVMGADQLKTLDHYNITVGSHCINHRHLPSLERTEAEREITESKKTLEKILAKEVRLLSFPHGAYNTLHVDIAKRAGYSRVFTISPQRALVSPDEYITGRIFADPRDWTLEYLLKILGAYQWLPFAYNLKQSLKKLQYRLLDRMRRHEN